MALLQCVQQLVVPAAPGIHFFQGGHLIHGDDVHSLQIGDGDGSQIFGDVVALDLDVGFAEPQTAQDQSDHDQCQQHHQDSQ